MALRQGRSVEGEGAQGTKQHKTLESGVCGQSEWTGMGGIARLTCDIASAGVMSVACNALRRVPALPKFPCATVVVGSVCIRHHRSSLLVQRGHPLNWSEDSHFERRPFSAHTVTQVKN